MYELLKGQVAVANKYMEKMLPKAARTGSISAADRKLNVMVIRPEGFSLSHLTGDAMAVIALDDGRVLSGTYCPVEDASAHLQIYRAFPEIESLAHVYPVWPFVFSQAGKSIPVLSREHASLFKNEIPCTAGSSSQDVINTMQNMERLEKGAILIKNDGLLVWDKTPLKSLDCAKVLAGIACSAWRANVLSQGQELPVIPPELAEQYYVKNQEKECAFAPVGKPGQRVTDTDERKICLEMLVYFDKVCRENNIKYSLTGGSLLGAVRHKGFIPWDDDADVFLARPEFDKLEKVFDDSHRFVYMTRKKDPNFSYVFSRLVDKKTYIAESPGTASFGSGVFLDICVVDGLPKSKLMRKLHMAYMRFLVRGRRATIKDPTSKSYAKKGPLVLFLKKTMRRFIPLSKWNNWMAKAMKRYAFDTSDYVGNFTSQYGKKELLHRRVFDEYIDVPFEGYHFMACAGYQEYLTNIYGSKYMDFPPEKKHKGHHPNVTYWVE